MFEMEVEEGDWKIMIEISDNHEKDRFRLKLEQKNRTSNGMNSYSIHDSEFN